MIQPSISRRNSGVYILMVLTFCLAFSFRCWASGPAKVSATPQKLILTAGKSIVVQSPQMVKRVSLAAPEIADVRVLSPREIYVIGKTPGLTNLTLWSDAEKISAIFDIEVLPDVGRIKEKLHEMLPQEQEVRVTATHDSVTLSGMVSGTANLSQVLALTQSYAPKVINLLEVGGAHQVMLEVRFSEMSRSLIKKLGVNFSYLSPSGSGFGMSVLDSLTTISSTNTYLSAGSGVNALFRFMGQGATWTFFIDALKDQGLLKVLAEPTLVTLSGKPANFLAGGEFPIPVPQVGGGTSTITIEYKTFGVGLTFTPTVLSNKKIHMEVAPEVSELDSTNAVSMGGYIIPGLTTRRVSTSIELADGQSFAIAGLLKDNVREIVRKFPLLGDIPVLGALFRSTSFQKNETELIIIVTPHLVKPLDMAKQTLPTDSFIEPNDFEWYLRGDLEGKGQEPPSASTTSTLPKSGGLEGDFGHIRP